MWYSVANAIEYLSRHTPSNSSSGDELRSSLRDRSSRRLRLSDLGADDEQQLTMNIPHTGSAVLRVRVGGRSPGSHSSYNSDSEGSDYSANVRHSGGAFRSDVEVIDLSEDENTKEDDGRASVPRRTPMEDKAINSSEEILRYWRCIWLAARHVIRMQTAFREEMLQKAEGMSPTERLKYLSDGPEKLLLSSDQPWFELFMEALPVDSIIYSGTSNDCKCPICKEIKQVLIDVEDDGSSKSIHPVDIPDSDSEEKNRRDMDEVFIDIKKDFVSDDLEISEDRFPTDDKSKDSKKNIQTNLTDDEWLTGVHVGGDIKGENIEQNISEMEFGDRIVEKEENKKEDDLIRDLFETDEEEEEESRKRSRSEIPFSDEPTDIRRSKIRRENDIQESQNISYGIFDDMNESSVDHSDVHEEERTTSLSEVKPEFNYDEKKDNRIHLNDERVRVSEMELENKNKNKNLTRTEIADDVYVSWNTSAEKSLLNEENESREEFGDVFNKYFENENLNDSVRPSGTPSRSAIHEVRRNLRKTIPTLVRSAPTCFLRNAPLSLRPNITLLRSFVTSGFCHRPVDPNKNIHMDIIGLLNKMVVTSRNCPVCFESHFRCRRSGFEESKKHPPVSDSVSSSPSALSAPSRSILTRLSETLLSPELTPRSYNVRSAVSYQAGSSIDSNLSVKKKRAALSKVTRAGLGVFPCGHVVCWRCIRDIYRSPKVRCPICRSETSIDSFPYPVYSGC